MKRGIFIWLAPVVVGLFFNAGFAAYVGERARDFRLWEVVAKREVGLNKLTGKGVVRGSYPGPETLKALIGRLGVHR